MAGSLVLRPRGGARAGAAAAPACAEPPPGRVLKGRHEQEQGPWRRCDTRPVTWP